MSPISKILSICLLFKLSLIAAFAEHQLSEFSLGERVSGPAVKLSDCQGKVVVIDYWGTRCPPCLALMPHMAKIHRKYENKGLVLIASESQGSPVDAIQKIIDSNRLECTVTRGVRGPSLSNGLPYMAIFDVDGKMVFRGRPGSESDKIIRNELRRVGSVESAGSKSAFGERLVDTRT